MHVVHHLFTRHDRVFERADPCYIEPHPLADLGPFVQVHGTAITDSARAEHVTRVGSPSPHRGEYPMNLVAVLVAYVIAVAAMYVCMCLT